MGQFIEYFLKHWDRMLQYCVQHVIMCVLAVGIALIISVVISVCIFKISIIKNLVVAILGAFYAIPSMAFFALLVPFLGLGMKDAIVVLVVYSLFILVRNIVTGFDRIDGTVLEAARGMGMNHFQIFFQIQIPLALPVIISGIRIAMMVTIGSATLAQTVNAGGLGVLLFDGLRSQNTVKILWGTILTAAVSLIANQLLVRLEAHSQTYVSESLVIQNETVS